MIRSSFRKVARTRYVMPLIVALAVIAVVVTEGAYQHARNTLKDSMALADARYQSSRTLQRLTDAETAARSYIASGFEIDRKNYHESMQEMRLGQKGVSSLLSIIDPDGNLLGDVSAHITEHAAELDAWVRTAEQGNATQAQTMANGYLRRQAYADLRSEFDLLQKHTVAAQMNARGSLVGALQLNRIALHALVALSVAALLLFMRQLRESDLREAEEHGRLSAQVALRTTALRNLAGHHVHAREDERGRVARELHDELGGLFTAMKLEIARLKRVAGVPDTAMERLLGVELRLNEGIAVKRRIIENLRPSSLDQLGLITALEVLCQNAATGLGIPVHTLLSQVELDKDAELTVFRLVQESLTNISKYAKATEVQVELAQTGPWVRVSVHDNGHGFDTDAVPVGHHGLLGMRVRVESHAGKLDIISAPGMGTRVEAELPAQASPPEEAAV